MASINRRTFIAGLAAVPALRPEIAAASPRTVGFVAESGKRGAWPLVVGLLVAPAPEAHDLQIELLRRQHGYPRTLRYMSTDRNKTAFAAALIDYTAAANDLTFTVVIADDALGKWPTIGDGKDAAYAGIYRQLVPVNPGFSISLPRRSDNRRDAALRASLANDLTIEPRRARRSNLAELAAFLSGCIYGEATGIANPLKRTLIERLRQKADPVRFSARTISI